MGFMRNKDDQERLLDINLSVREEVPYFALIWKVAKALA